MKHTSSALIFPGTEPSLHVTAKLLIFFETLSYYLPSEPVGPDNRDSNFFSSLCSGYAPAPLGEDLSRFNRLLREMETARPGEFSRLFSAARPPVAAGQAGDLDETSAGSVYSALQKDAGTEAVSRYKERLWQARLLLKLAELLDRREAELRQGLAQVASAEQNIFASLEGPDETAADGPRALGSQGNPLQSGVDTMQPDEPAPGTFTLRVKAWAELYLADPSETRPLTLAASNRESGILLLDRCQNTWRRDPEKLFSLSLPRLHPANIEGARDQYLQARNTFRVAVRENLEYFAGFIRQIAGTAGAAPGNQGTAPLLAANVSAWEEKVKDHFSGPETGFIKLDFYCFPGIATAALLQGLFDPQGPVPAASREHPTGILAILNS